MTEIDSTIERWSRDMNWVINSPFLMPCQLDLPLVAAPPPPTPYGGHRVGYYFENLVEAMLEHTPGIEILASGQQVIDNGRTIGELDFIFRDQNKTVHHWEVAAKFYLYDADKEVLDSHFIGPNAGDTFERKYRKITDQQLPLSRSAFPEVTERSAFVKGRIFHHPEQNPPEQLPTGLQPNHMRGTWLRQSETSLLTSTGGEAFCILQKPHWLGAEVLPHDDNSLITIGKLKQHLNQHFSEKDHPFLIAALQKKEDAWHEVDRIFVVSDQWPALKE